MGAPSPPSPAAAGHHSYLRLFLAVGLPAQIRDQLAACARPIPGARWVSAPQLHLTLRFLGKVAASQLPALTRSLAAVRAAAFDLRLAGLGQFPPGSPAPRVLWAGVAPAAPVQALKGAIDGVLGPDPEERDRAFAPHVTLARLKDAPGQDEPLRAFHDDHGDLGSPPFSVTAFGLYQSQTLPGGPEYSVLAEYPLVTP